MGFYPSLTCKKCSKWVHTPKSCAVKNAQAANLDCHQYGDNKMDKKCFKKEITPGTLPFVEKTSEMEESFWEL